MILGNMIAVVSLILTFVAFAMTDVLEGGN